MKTLTCYLLFTLMPLSMAMGQKVDLQSALRTLDATVKKRELYIQKRQQVIDHLKKNLETSTIDNDKYTICRRIYDEYQKFDADSALAYVYRCQRLAIKNKQKEWMTQAKIDEILILIYRGEFIAVKGRLEEYGPIENLSPQIQPQLAMASLEYYMRMHGTGYVDVADKLSSSPELCWNKYKRYIPTDSWCYDYYESIVTGHHIEGRLIKRLRTLPEPSVPAAMIEVTLAKLYKSKNNSELYYYYLIESAINDICSGNREAQSLILLIESPYVRKDNERAFTYAMVCTENAKAYKDTGRSLDIVGAHAIITKTFEAELEHKNIYLSIIIALLGVLVIVALMQLRLIIKKRKRQNDMMTDLKEMNIKLQKHIDKENEMQQKLKENNECLQAELDYRNNNFLNVYLLVSRYIADVQKFKRSVFNQLIGGKIDNAKKALNASEDTEKYLQNFYNQFDKAYLSTHPDFLQRFNELMKPDKQITVPNPDSLTPELRIYALVSLGITDSVSIAEFLHYSTQTIYNYRLKIRHNSCIPEKDFADAVANMYYQQPHQ